jgi:hypothetical protein
VTTSLLPIEEIYKENCAPVDHCCQNTVIGIR